MSSSYRLLKSFHDPALGEPLVELLQQNHIPFDVEDTSPQLDVTFSGSMVQHVFRILVPTSHFEEANALMDELAQRHLEESPVDSDHYLFQFSDEELLEVIVKRDEWGKEDILLSRKILSDRGKPISEEEIADLWQTRLKELRKPERAHWGWIIAAIVLSGPLGLLIGWYWTTLKKTDPTGYKTFVYDEFTRKVGRVVFVLSILTFAFAILSGFYSGGILNFSF